MHAPSASRPANEWRVMVVSCSAALQHSAATSIVPTDSLGAVPPSFEQAGSPPRHTRPPVTRHTATSPRACSAVSSSTTPGRISSPSAASALWAR